MGCIREVNMPAGDDLRIGKIAANTDSYSMGMEGADISVTPQTLPNSDYNSNRTNSVNNNTGFLRLTSQHTTTPFDSKAFDFVFNDAGGVGFNPFNNNLPETATKQFIG